MVITYDDKIARKVRIRERLGNHDRANYRAVPTRLPKEALLNRHLLHAFSSDSSLQSGLPLQKSSLSTHSPLPHDNLPSGQTGSSVLRMGNTLRGSANCNPR